MTDWQILALVTLAWCIVFLLVLRNAVRRLEEARKARDGVFLKDVFPRLVDTAVRVAGELDQEHEASLKRFEAERDRMNREFEEFRDGIRGDRHSRSRA